MSKEDSKNGMTRDAAQDRDAFVERLLNSVKGVFDVFSIYIGVRLGFYRALANGAHLTAAELADRTGTYERYVREWLEQQAVAGILEVKDAKAKPEARRFCLSPAQAEVLVEEDSLNYLAPLTQLVAGAVHPVSHVLEAYRTGRGVDYAAYGGDLVEGQAGINRAMFLKELGAVWLPQIPDVHGRLLADPPARVADVGCGAGWSSIGIARAYPKVRVDGFDLDSASVELARANLQRSSCAGQVEFHLRNAADPKLGGAYDLVTAFECIHDMSDPVAALKAMRNLAGTRGAVIVVDERVAESFMGVGNDVEWMMYGWSVLHCLPVGKAAEPSAETGTVMRPDTLRHYAHQAGYGKVEILPIENYFFRFYRLFP